MAKLTNPVRIDLGKKGSHALALAAHGPHLYAARYKDDHQLEIWHLATQATPLTPSKLFTVRDRSQEKKPHEKASRGVSLAVKTGTSPQLVAAYREKPSGSDDGGGEPIKLATWDLGADGAVDEKDSQEIEYLKDKKTVSHADPAGGRTFQTTLDPQTDATPALVGGATLRLAYKTGRHSIGLAWETATGEWDWPYHDVTDVHRVKSRSYIIRDYGQAIRVGERPGADPRDNYPHTEQAPALTSDWVVAFKDGYKQDGRYHPRTGKDDDYDLDHMLVLEGADGAGWTAWPANGRSRTESGGHTLMNAPGVLVKGCDPNRPPLTHPGVDLVDAPGGTDVMVYSNGDTGVYADPGTSEVGVPILYQATGGVSGIAGEAGPFPHHSALRGPAAGTGLGPFLQSKSRPRVAYQAQGQKVWLSFVDPAGDLQLYRFDYSP